MLSTDVALFLTIYFGMHECELMCTKKYIPTIQNKNEKILHNKY